MSVVALIVAAGRGLRASGPEGSVPKQFRALGGMPMLARTIDAFAAHPRIDAVMVVIHPDDADLYETIASPFASRLRPPALGGLRRQDSVRAGLEALSGAAPDHVLIHDGARPFVEAALIDRVIDALKDHDGALPCLPVTDTLKRADDRRIAATLDRDGLWRAQTPQGFRFEAILAAHRAAAQTKADVTDDAAIAEAFGLDVIMVAGAEGNRKLTSAEDIGAADELLGLRAGAAKGSTRVGSGYDVHAFGPGDHVMLCGVRIPHDQKLTGHSDADVALHALTDALLGAIGGGDIGVHFPPSDPRWKGASSDLFLADAAARVRARGGEIVHVDVTLLCEAPRIGPHRDAMLARLAAILGLSADQVSVKATTNEGLGFIGRKEGIAAMAIATVKLP